MFLIICSILLITCASLTVWDTYSDWSQTGWLAGSAFIGGFLVLVFGFAMIGIMGSAKDKITTIKDFQVAKTDAAAIFTARGLSTTFNDAFTVNRANDIQEIYLHTRYNHYGFEIGKTLSLEK